MNQTNNTVIRENRQRLETEQRLERIEQNLKVLLDMVEQLSKKTKSK